MSHDDAVRYNECGPGTHFDTDVVDAFHEVALEFSGVPQEA
jgi:hypothetical protein